MRRTIISGRNASSGGRLVNKPDMGYFYLKNTHFLHNIAVMLVVDTMISLNNIFSPS